MALKMLPNPTKKSERMFAEINFLLINQDSTRIGDLCKRRSQQMVKVFLLVLMKKAIRTFTAGLIVFFAVTQILNYSC